MGNKDLNRGAFVFPRINDWKNGDQMVPLKNFLNSGDEDIWKPLKSSKGFISKNCRISLFLQFTILKFFTLVVASSVVQYQGEI